MNRGGGTNLRQRGFTIVETLIVLAVSSLLFVSASIYINGRQNKTNFQIGARQIQQQFQQIISQARRGYYPNDGTVKCELTGSAPLKITSDPNPSTTRGDCVFVGNAIIVGDSAHANEIRVVPIAGRRVVNNQDVTSLVAAWPTAIASGAAKNTTAPDMSTIVNPENNLEFVSAKAYDSGSGSQNNVKAVAMMSNLSSFVSGSSGTSGSQNFSLYRFSAPWDGTSNQSEVDSINSEATNVPTAWTLQLSKVEYCFASGGTDQSVLVTIDGASLGVTYDIKSGRSC